MDTITRAQGRWKEILPRFGVDSGYLKNRHGPCPLCGGKDRFRFDDKEGSGSYFCNQCGAGAGIILIRKLKGWDHATACREVDAIIGSGAPLTQPERQDDRARRLAAIERLLGWARSPEIVADYLHKRGLSVQSKTLVGHPAVFHTEEQKRLPAVIAPIHGPDGRLQSVQRIFVAQAKP